MALRYFSVKLSSKCNICRSHNIHKYIPLDLHVTYHKFCGVLLSIFSFIHTVVHIINLDINIVSNMDFNIQNFTFNEWLLTGSPGFLGTIPGYGYPTGVCLSFVLGMHDLIVCKKNKLISF